MENPLVSIIIPVYNGANYLCEAIDSALAQTYENIEILVVNDGSNDGGKTREIALSYGDRIRYFEKENGGVSTALNLALAEMRGEYFSWLSHDDVYLPDKVQTEIDAVMENGDPTVPVYSGWERLVMPDGTSTPYMENEERYDRTYFEDGFRAVFFGLISGCSLLIHKSYFQKHGGFDEEQRNNQDYRKWFEMFCGKRMVYISRPLIRSRVHQLQGTVTHPEFQRENDDMHCWMLRHIAEHSAMLPRTDYYTFLGMALLRLENVGYENAYQLAYWQILPLRESPDGAKKRAVLQERLHELCGEKPVLYCMGRRGRALLHGLYLRGLPVYGYSDSSAGARDRPLWGALPLTPGEIPHEAAVIITKERPNEIYDYVASLGVSAVLTYNSIEQLVMETPVDSSLLRQEEPGTF